VISFECSVVCDSCLQSIAGDTMTNHIDSIGAAIDRAEKMGWKLDRVSQHRPNPPALCPLCARKHENKTR
jgi:hypothetical protein